MKIKAAAAVLAAVVMLGAGGWLLSRSLAPRNEAIVLIPKTTDPRVEFWQVLNQGVMAAAKEYKADIQIKGASAESQIDEQIKIVEETIAEKPKAIILAASDYNRLVPTAKKVIDAGITLITVDSGLAGGVSASLIATDNYAAGRNLVETMRGYVQGPATYAIVSFVKTSDTQIDRENGVRDGLKGDPSATVIETLYSNNSEDEAYKLTKQLLQERSDIRGIFGLNEVSTIGAARALKEMDPGRTIKLVGFDNSMNEVSFMEAGILQATVVQKPFNMGYLAVKTALQAHRGDPVSRKIDTGSELITKENMYTNENQKLLFPFVGK
ncbi:substrate-binding domain-containing protein [Paenibacillus whitsoniae]|uniref:LacI family transcriptional regulator n=1 Tax=Paenibacillus whitsoniae TaxID=2496558 RepID=A0A3S0C662_9BACL|nr:substrate-binding domain-containing protein [Paenibacillus whitsoniae]RTE02246.1 LacI family transcriptional regulator [Paenibacillus whitsoniae]